jgi:anti-sigma regulatory factor (Ser/Thr protein kinase)
MSENTLILEIEPEFAKVDFVRAKFLGICRQAFPGPESESLCTDFILAMTEAMNNAVEHSGATKILVELSVSDNDLSFRMTTDGVRFDPTAETTLHNTDFPEGMPEGGFGLTIMKKMADHREYTYHDGKNILFLKKKVHSNTKGTEDGD